ncbi:MAG: tetratricopeptide repeat protein [Acidobacteriota bacterium]
MKRFGIAGMLIMALVFGLLSGCKKRKSVAITPRAPAATTPYQSADPADLSEYIRTVLKISQENTVASEEKLAELLKAKPQLVALIQVAGANARDIQSRTLLAEAYFKAGLHRHAFQLYQEIKTIAPQDPIADLGLAKIWNEWGDYALASQHAEAALRLAPDSVKGLELLGKIKLQTNDLDGAISSFLSAIQLAPDNGSLYANAGYVYLARGDFQPARYYLERAVNLEPFLPEAQNNLGITLGHLGDYPNALRAFTIANGRVAGLNNLGVVYMEQRQWADACKAFRQALAIDPTYQKARKNLIEAEKRIPSPTVIELKPFSETSSGIVHLKPSTSQTIASGQFKQGVQVIGEKVETRAKPKPLALSGSTNRVSIAFHDAVARLKNRRYAEALEMFNWLLRQYSEPETVSVCQYWIGECYWGLGDKAKARLAFSRVVAYGNATKRRDALLMLKRIANAERLVTKTAKG